MTRWLFNLSIKRKIPLWGAALIIVSTLSVCSVFLYRSYHNIESTLATSAGTLGSTLARTLIPSLLHDDVWRGFEIVRAPFTDAHPDNPFQPVAAMVVTKAQTIFVSSDPDNFPMLTELRDLGQGFPDLIETITPLAIPPTTIIAPDDSEFTFAAIPMIDSDTRLGTLVLLYSRSSLYYMFAGNALHGAIIGLVVLAVLLPINWYWGQRMATPLVRLAHRMDEIQTHLPEQLRPELYNYNDELGHLFKAYNRMVVALREKEQLERGILSAERLAAIGRLTAGIAHEINNPLAGMLTALDTLKQRDHLDERSLRTLGLVERGLLQVKDTVAALLVEARQQKRRLERQDLEDVHTLMQSTTAKRRVKLDFDIDVPASTAVPASPVRQVVINLLNNAIQAAGDGGWVKCAITTSPEQVRIEVINNGDPILPERLKNLFEPFVSYREGGHGLGLWVTYQLVQQMAGVIEVDSRDGTVSFVVTLPIDENEVEAA